jgi:uncharacterized membrane protein HdeD (DUF308 family)
VFVLMSQGRDQTSERRSAMAGEMTAGVHKAATWSVVVSVLMIGAGVLAIGLPLVAGVAVATVLGWMLVLGGILHVALAWRNHTARSVVWEILLGLAYGAIGFYILARPLASLASLTLIVAAYLLVEAVIEFVMWLQVRGAPGTIWLLFDGVVTLVLACMIWSTWPSSATWVIGTLVGISIFFSGISRLVLSLAVRRVTA